MSKPSLSDIRRQYGQDPLLEEQVSASPIVQFEQWMQDALTLETEDPTAMVLSTTDAMGYPDARVVLLKEIMEEQFIFYTHYESQKGQDILHHPWGALTFYWAKQARQVRIRGKIVRISEVHSDRYFASRPFMSQIGALVSKQSQVIASRLELERLFAQALEESHEKASVRPASWGGYAVIPSSIEFWQGRDDRLHDRLRYQKLGDIWTIERLAP